MSSAAQGLVYDEDIDTAGLAAVTIAAATAKTAGALAPGRYFLYSTTDCYVKRGPPSSVTASADPSQAAFLPANTLWPIQVTPSDINARDAIAVIQDTAGGTLRITRADRKGSR